MGGIDLDPASSEKANLIVGAKKIYTELDDGLKYHWHGKVWMNHPYGKKTNPLWINHLLTEVQAGRVEQACIITYAATSEKWFQPLLKQPQVFLCPRTNYYLPNGKKKAGVTKGSVVTYFGRNPGRFAYCFRSLGICKLYTIEMIG